MRGRPRGRLHADLTAALVAPALIFLGTGSSGGPAWAGDVTSTTEVVRSGKSRQRHPKRWEGLFVVPRDIDQDGHLSVSYWRVAEKRPDRGKVSVEIEVWRDTDGDGTTDDIETLPIAGDVEDQAYDETIGPLAPLRAGDLILFLARLKKMPRLGRYRRATFEVTLLDSPASCPESSGLPGDVSPPTRILGPAPQYTDEARQERIQGVVIVEGIIGCDGRVTHIRVLKSLPLGLDQEGVEALSQWRFEPARVDGIPVEVIYNLTINFRLQTPGTRSGSTLKPSVSVDGQFFDPRRRSGPQPPRIEPPPRR